MPTISISGINLDLSPEAAAVAQRWTGPLQTAAQALLDSASSSDPRVQPALAAARLAPLFRGLIDVLAQATQLLATTGTPPDEPSGPLQSAVQDAITRYTEGFLQALDRLLGDWDQLGPIFFTHGSDDDVVRYQLLSLRGVDPLPGALAQGGVPSLVLRLAIGSAGTSPGSQFDADLVYLPHDVETECTLVGNTTHLCSLGPDYIFLPDPCNHPWCRSVAERVNTQLGDSTAIPTCIFWPAAAGSNDIVPADAYGYREHLPSGRPEDTTVPSPQAPEVAAFYRTLGRELALAAACGAQGVDAQDFVVRRLRPCWIEPGTGFALPLGDLRATGMFDPPGGPLAPPVGAPPSGDPPAPRHIGLVATAPGGRTPSVPIRAAGSIPDMQRGCAETLEALAALALELGDRFQNGRNILSFFRPREDTETRARQTRWLEILSLASSWGDWQALDAEIARWRQADDTAWTRHWFGGLLAQLQATVSAWPQPPSEAAADLVALRDQVTGALGVQNFSAVTVEAILALAPATREPVWQALVALARVLSGYWRGRDWQPFLEQAWTPLPVGGLLEFEIVDHARARIPYFVRRLQSASLWSAVDGREISPTGFADAPPPRLARPTFFPEPMSAALVRQFALLENAGFRSRLTATIPALMANPAPTPATPAPAGPPLVPAGIAR